MSMVFGAISRILAVCCVISMMGMAASTAVAQSTTDVEEAIALVCEPSPSTSICISGYCRLLVPGTCQILPTQDPDDPSGQTIICCYVP